MEDRGLEDLGVKCSAVQHMCVLSVGQRPQLGGLIGGGAEKDELRGVPAALDDLVLVLRHDDAFQRLRQVALHVGEDDLVVVAAGEEVVGLAGEAQRPNVGAVRVEGLNDAATADVVQHTGGVLVTGDEQLPGGVDGHGGHCAAYKKDQTKSNHLEAARSTRS